MYVELAEHNVNNRGEIVEVSKVGIEPVNYERYCSLFPFDATIIEYVNINKSIKGHTGLHYCNTVYFDIDYESDLNKAKEDTLKLIIRLNKDFSIKPNELLIYFTGGKGFHVGISSKMFGGISPSTDIGERIKDFAKGVTTGIECIDFKIYENHRLFRIPNSVNTKSGLYKIEISFNELETLSIEQIKNIAKSHRKGFVREISISSLSVNDKLKTAIRNSKPEIVVADKELNEPGFFRPAKQGNRNDKLFRQALLLFGASELNKNAIIDIISSINIASGDPLSDYELNQAISSAEKYAKRNTKQKENLELKSFGEWTNEWVDSLRDEENKITLGLDTFDEEMKGKLRGKLGVILGYGGSKKSLYSAFIEFRNITRHGYRCIYSTMEMGVSNTMDRFIDMAIETKNYNASYEIGELEKNEKGIAQRLMTEAINPIYSDKLLITQNSSLRCEDYDLMIQQKITEVGNIDILVVDGLSMMGGGEKETENYSKNSKELKELAKKYNILILLIAHVSRGMKKYYKDLSGLVRGSEKIIDNCDFHISMSQVLDEGKSSPKEEVYIEDLGYATLVNKRGSGKTISVGFKLNTKRLYFEESSEATEIVERSRTDNEPNF